MIGAGILFLEYEALSWYDILGSSVGFAVNVVAVLMLYFFKVIIVPILSHLVFL